MLDLGSQIFIFGKEFTCVVYVFWEINDRIWRVTKSLRIGGFRFSFNFTISFLIITWLGRFSFFFLLCKFKFKNWRYTSWYISVFLPIPKDSSICFQLKWNSQTMTFFVLLNISAPVRLYLLIICNHFLCNAGSFGNIKSAIPVFTLFAS